MIKVENEIINFGTFPDGSLLVKYNPTYNKEKLCIKWYFESNSELWNLIVLTKHIQSKGYEVELYLPYCPNSRQDRIKNEEDIFTLKWFAGVINNLGFKKITTIDLHSDVGAALFDNIYCVSILPLVKKVIKQINVSGNNLILYYPDAGCVKRLLNMFSEYNWVSANKKRDWETGQIQGLDVIDNGIDLKGKTVLIVDDICSRGGTFYHSAKKLKELGVGKIYLYVTHCENTILEGEVLSSGLIDRVFTTNSIFTKEHEKITVMEV